MNVKGSEGGGRVEKGWGLWVMRKGGTREGWYTWQIDLIFNIDGSQKSASSMEIRDYLSTSSNKLFIDRHYSWARSVFFFSFVYSSWTTHFVRVFYQSFKKKKKFRSVKLFVCNNIVRLVKKRSFFKVCRKNRFFFRKKIF